MNAVVVSAHYAPGHVSHLMAFHSLLSDMGYETILYLDARYRDVLWDKNTMVAYIGEHVDIPELDLIIVYNISTQDSMIVRALPKRQSCKSFFVYHEPWRGLGFWLKDIIGKRARPRAIVVNSGIHAYTIKTLRAVDCVLLPSTEAYSLYEKRDLRVNRNYRLFPLVFSDECTDEVVNGERKYFSYIATADEKRNFPLFLQFISKYLNEDPGFQALIATRSNIDRFWDGSLDEFVRSGRLVVKAGRDMSNEELNDCFKQTKVAWLLYHYTTQSGVLARAFMCGCPVLVGRVGCLPEYVDGNNGLICDSEKLEDIYLAYCQIRDRESDMSIASRQSFAGFRYDAHTAELQSIIDSLKKAR